MNKIRNRLLILTSIIFSILLFIASYAFILNPAIFPLPAFISLFFPVIWIVNIAVIFITLFYYRQLIWISLLAIILSLYQITLIFNIWGNNNYDTSKNNISLITYNTGNEDPLEKKITKEQLFNSSFFSNSDIICLQEFKPSDEYKIAILESYPYSISIDYYANNSRDSSGLSIYSNFEISKFNWLKQKGEDTYALWCNLTINKDTILLINVQLQSIRLEDDEINAISSMSGFTLIPSKLSMIYSKIKRGYKWREEQVKVLSKLIADSRYPVLLCGDFNDPPSSFTYNRLSSTLYDSFFSSSLKLGTTYKGSLPFLRIDYVLVSDSINILIYYKLNNSFSDHYPIKVHFEI